MTAGAVATVTVTGTGFDVSAGNDVIGSIGGGSATVTGTPTGTELVFTVTGVTAANAVNVGLTVNGVVATISAGQTKVVPTVTGISACSGNLQCCF